MFNSKRRKAQTFQDEIKKNPQDEKMVTKIHAVIAFNRQKYCDYTYRSITSN